MLRIYAPVEFESVRQTHHGLLDEWADEYIKTLEEHMKANLPPISDFFQEVLKFLRGQTET
jgi:hypothetical protein